MLENAIDRVYKSIFVNNLPISRLGILYDHAEDFADSGDVAFEMKGDVVFKFSLN